MNIEFYGLTVGLIFIALGIWIGLSLYYKKIVFPKRKSGIYELSTREQEVLFEMSKGLSNQQIADNLYVSLSTIKTHSRKNFFKIECATQDPSHSKSARA